MPGSFLMFLRSVTQIKSKYGSGGNDGINIFFNLLHYFIKGSWIFLYIIEDEQF